MLVSKLKIKPFEKYSHTFFIKILKDFGQVMHFW